MAEAKHGDLLFKVVKNLKARGFTEREKHRDARGTYAAIMETPEKLPFALVAKGSDIMGEIVSVQKELLEIWNAPLVLAWLPPGEEKVQFYVFNPADCLTNQHFFKSYENERLGSSMWNFSIYLGKRWKPLEESLESKWNKVKDKPKEQLDMYT